MNGIINIYKPTGISSFKCLSIVKRELVKLHGSPIKIGHLGTLDPAACGVLVLLVGSATKLNTQLNTGTKVYRSIFTFGIETDTLDTEGVVIANSDIIPNKTQIRAAIADLTGQVEIEVPKYSAIHINGKRAYELARDGKDFTPPKRMVSINRFELLDDITKDMPDFVEKPSIRPNSFAFEIECETGTYIRSLAKLLAQKLGTVAIASTIIRTRVGDFDIGKSRLLNNVSKSDILPT